MKGETAMKAHQIRMRDYYGKVENIYEVTLEQYSEYYGNWSVMWRDIYAESEEDIMEWVNNFMEETREYWKKHKFNNKIRFKSYRKIEYLPYQNEYPTEEEILLENRLEGCLGDD